MQMAPNLVGARNQQSSARNNNRPRLKVVPRASNPELKPPITYISIATPPVGIHRSRAVASPALHTHLLNCASTLTQPLGANALLDITRRASLTAPFRTHWPTNWIDKEDSHRAIWLRLRAPRKMQGRVRATRRGAGEGREINTSTWARSAGEFESRKCAHGERGKGETDNDIVKLVLC